MSFKIPTSDTYPFLCTLDSKYQEIIWSNEYERHRSNVEEMFSEYLQQIKDNYSGLISHRESGANITLENSSDGKDLGTEGINEFTGEKLQPKSLKDFDPGPHQDLHFISELIAEYEIVLRNPKELLVDYLWQIKLNEYQGDYIEKLLLRDLENLPEYQDLLDSFHIFFGRDPENERLRSAHLAKWQRAQELAKSGDDSLLSELQKLAPDAEAAAKAGKRITSQDGDCYVCGKFIPHFGGELILWNEIPKSYFYEHLGGEYRKWRVRHFSDECSQDKFGKRIHLLHLKEHTGWKNEKADTCWLCGDEVPVGEGWLVLATAIPKWKHAKKAFPKARAKKYYVQCSNDDA